MSNEIEIWNAKITKTSLGTVGGRPNFYYQIDIEFSDDKGCYRYISPDLDVYVNFPDRREGTKKGLDKIMFLMSTVGVDRWEDLTGTSIRCKIKNGYILYSIGHITKDIWFPEDASYGLKYN